MARGKKFRSVLGGVLAAAVMALAATPASAAGPAAVEEYVLTLPGVDRLGSEGPKLLIQRGRDAGPVGVVGETEAGSPLLGPVASAIASPAGVALLLALGASAWLATGARGRRR